MNYNKLGFRAGLEIHRQINTKKLFCSCPSVFSEKIDKNIERRLRSVKSETGEEDTVAKYEMGRNRYAIYEITNESCCLLELDDEPANQINKEALYAAFIVAKMLNCKFVDEIEVMRKQVLDYSNTSGFQRSMLLAINGFIETSKGKVGIQTICLEEDAARKIKDEGDYIIYRLDRLGIPLVEIATAPDIKDPEHVKEVAEKLGMILKSTGKFKSGLGTIRQDVNISVHGHPRVEIKGFQDLRSIPKVVEYEIKRQLNAKKKKQRLKSEVRKVEQDLTTSFLRPMPGAARLYVETDVPKIEITKELLDKIDIPKLISEKVEGLEEMFNLQPEIAREIIKKEINFEHFVSEYRNIEPTTIARILIEVPKEIKSRLNLDTSKLTEDNFYAVLELINENKVSKDAAIDVLADLIKLGKIDLNKYKTVSDTELEKEIKKIVEKNKGASFGALMGIAMSKFKGKTEGKKIAELIKKFIK